MNGPTCIACNRRLKSHVAGFGGSDYELWYCPGCRTNHTLPLPSERELERFYQGFMFNVPAGARASERERHIRASMRAMIGHLRTNYHLAPNDARILDFGGGIGICASEFGRMGYRVDLYDMDSKACEYARERFSYDLKLVTGVEGELEEEAYDLVYSSQVIEHVLDPVQHFRNLFKKLRSGGILVLTTPNQQSHEYCFRLSWLRYHLAKCRGGGQLKRFRAFRKQKWLNFDPPRHLYGFNRRGLQLIAEKGGFQKLACFSELGHQSIFNSPRPMPGWRSGVIPFPLQTLEVFGLRIVAALKPSFFEGNNLVYIGMKP